MCVCVCVRICYRFELDTNAMEQRRRHQHKHPLGFERDQFNGNSCISYSSKKYFYRLFWFRINSNEINSTKTAVKFMEVPMANRLAATIRCPILCTRYNEDKQRRVSIKKKKNFWPRDSGEFVWAIAATTAVATVLHFRYSEFVGSPSIGVVMTLLKATGLLTEPTGRQASVVSTQTCDNNKLKIMDFKWRENGTLYLS